MSIARTKQTTQHSSCLWWKSADNRNRYETSNNI